MLYAFFDHITYGAKFLTKNSLIFEFQRYHKEPWLMVCNFYVKYERIAIFELRPKIWCLYELYLQCNTADFHSLYILEFHGKAVVTI